MGNSVYENVFLQTVHRGTNFVALKWFYKCMYVPYLMPELGKLVVTNTAVWLMTGV